MQNKDIYLQRKRICKESLCWTLSGVYPEWEFSGMSLMLKEFKKNDEE